VPTILVADDNSNIQKMVTLAFKEEGIAVVAVGNGDAAVKKAAEILPDLILADIFMPVKNGYEVCEFVKQDEKLANVPVILLVGAFDPFNEREAQRVNADGVLKKPFVPPDPLINLVKNLIAQHAPKLEPVAVSVSEPVSAIAMATPLVEPPPMPAMPRAVTVDTYEEEIEESPVAEPVKDFSLNPSEVVTDHERGTDAFREMLESAPLGLIRPLLKPFSRKDKKKKSAEPDEDSSGIFTTKKASSSAAVEDGSSKQQESVDDSAQFTPLRDQIVRDWGALGGSTSHANDEEEGKRTAFAGAASEIKEAVTDETTGLGHSMRGKIDEGVTPTSEGWRATFPFSTDKPAQILSPNETGPLPWRGFKFTPDHTDKAVADAPPADESVATAAEEVPVRTELAVEEKCESAAIAEAPSPVEETAQAPVVEASKEPAAAAQIAEAAPKPADAGCNIDFPAISAPAVSAVAFSDKPAEQPVALQPEQIQAAKPAASTVETPQPAESTNAVESFAVPGAALDPRVIEEVVARVVERMQPQILEVVTREVLKPVVEALVRRQMEQK